MTVPGAWICRACWKMNRPGDTRCYRCHAPRTADDLPMQGRPGGGAGAAGNDEGPILGLLVALPSVVFKWAGRLYLVGGVIYSGITILLVLEPRAPQFGWLLSAGFAAGFFLLAFTMRWASRAMRHRNPWAFVVALAFSVGIGGVSLYTLTTFAPASATANPLNYVTIGIFGFTAIMAALGLLLSLAPDDGP